MGAGRDGVRWPEGAGTRGEERGPEEAPAGEPLPGQGLGQCEDSEGQLDGLHLPRRHPHLPAGRFRPRRPQIVRGLCSERAAHPQGHQVVRVRSSRRAVAELGLGPHHGDYLGCQGGPLLIKAGKFIYRYQECLHFASKSNNLTDRYLFFHHFDPILLNFLSSFIYIS